MSEEKTKQVKTATKDSTVEMSSEYHGKFMFLDQWNMNGFIHTHHGMYVPGVGVVSRTTESDPTGISESSVVLPTAKIVFDKPASRYLIVKA